MDHNNSEIPHTRLLMTNARTIPNFQRRTVEGARHLRDNFSNVIREIQPLMETARTVNAGVQNALYVTNLLHGSQETNHNASASDNSFVINLDQHVVNEGEGPAAALNNLDDVQNSMDDEVNSTERSQAFIEGQQALRAILKYVPCFMILFLKAVYDYHESIFIFIILFITFGHTNAAVKKETTKRDRRSLKTLSIELLYIAACSIYIYYSSQDENNFDISFFLLIRTFSETLTVGKLLWMVIVTDFVLKIITVTTKIVLTMLPGKILPFQKRGKVYLLVEAISQMYRSLATIQPWLHYLLEAYQGSEKVVAVFLSAFYMISKGNDLVSRVKMLKTAFIKLLQTMSIGSAPSKEQMQTAGEHCPICHDDYESPVLLQCRHIFCENCVTTWFDREQTCPLCRAKIVDDPSWRDGSTAYYIQLY